MALMSLAVIAKSQNLALMPQAQRDAILISRAKAVILRYGPDYYREYKPPVIKRLIAHEKFLTLGIEDKHAGRAFYSILYLYDKSKEILDGEYAAIVAIWEDTGKPFGVGFGNRVFCSISILIPNEDFENDNVTEPVKYEQKRIVPFYKPKGFVAYIPDGADSITIDKLIKDAEKQREVYLQNRVPDNIDELKKHGYGEIEKGKWVKVKQDIPPKY